MLTRYPLMTLHRKIIYNFVWIYPGQHYIRKLLAQCRPRAHRYTFAGKPAFSNMSGGLFFNWVHYHRTIVALFIQCWFRSLFTACGTTMNRGRHWLEHNNYTKTWVLKQKRNYWSFKFFKFLINHNEKRALNTTICNSLANILKSKCNAKNIFTAIYVSWCKQAQRGRGPKPRIHF